MYRYTASRMAVVLGIAFFLCLPGLHANVQKELGLSIRGEYNRVFSPSGDVSLFGAIGLNDWYTFRSGLAMGHLDNTTEIKAFGSGHAALPFSVIPLHVNLAYKYYGLPGAAYNLHTHSLLPSVALNGRRAGLELGISFRFTSFFGEASIFEPALAFSGYVNLIHNERVRIGLSCANFNDFYMGNMGAYSFRIHSDIYVTSQWTLAFELELLQSGGGGLTSAFYGIAYRGGMKLAW